MSELQKPPSTLNDPKADECRPVPLFSIVITTFNRPNLLIDALASLSRQTFNDFEALLVNDNGFPVESLLTNVPFAITYICQAQNRGPAAARNTANRLARGHYIAYLDDDDLFQPDHLETLASAIKQYPSEVIYSDAIFIIEDLVDGKRIELRRENRYTHQAYCRERLLISNYIPVNTFAFPRRLLKLFDGFDESLEGLEDWDFLMNLANHANFRHIPRETVEVRMRSTTADATRRSALAMRLYPRLYRQIYDRHPDLDSENIRLGRTAMLQHLDVSLSQGQHQKKWLEYRSVTPAQRELALAQIATHPCPPIFAFAVVDLEGDLTKLTATLDSLKKSAADYPHLLTISFSVSTEVSNGDFEAAIHVTRENWIAAINQSIALRDFDWLGILHAGEELISSGVLLSGLELLNAPDCHALYFDVMYQHADGSHGLALRPDFNLDYLLSLPSVMGRHWLFRRNALLQAGGFDSCFGENPEFELALRMITNKGLQGLGHIAEVVLKAEPPPIQELTEEKKAILQHLAARGYEQAQAKFESTGQYRIWYGHNTRPLVSILILVGDKLSHLQRCIESLLEKTGYSHYEILLIHNAREAQNITSWLKDLEDLKEAKLRIISCPSFVDTASALNNAADHALGDYLLLLSPETAVIQESWLDELLNHAQRPEVGAVGAKLISSEGTIVQAGLILGLEGVASSAFSGEQMDSPGYLQRLQTDQNYSAIRRDCLMISKAIFNQVHGFDTEQSAHYIDVDLCLRLKEAGFLNVWAANSILLSSEKNQAEPYDDDITMYQKWLPILARDTAYNPNLSLSTVGGFSLTDNSLSWRPLSSWKPLPSILAYTLDHAENNRYRIRNPMQAMTSRGQIEGFLSQTLLQPCELERLQPDTIIVQRTYSDFAPNALNQIKTLSNAFKVLDMGDHPAAWLSQREQQPHDLLRALHHELAFADRVLVPTESFAETLKNTHPEVLIVQSRLPAELWGSLIRSQDSISRPRIGWSGSADSVVDLKLLSEIFEDLHEEVDWIIIGKCPAALHRYAHEVHDWKNFDRLPHKLAQLNLDLAIAPLTDNPTNRWAGNLQILKYGACGYPVIRSKLDSTTDKLPTALTNNNSKAWIDTIRMHLSEKDASRQLGQYFQTLVRNEWLLDNQALEVWKKSWLPA